MAKDLNLVMGASKFAVAPVKLERKKLYGWTELRVQEPDGAICRQAGLGSDGQTIVPKGAVKIGMVRDDGLWMEKSELKAVHADGTEVVPVPSSFDADIALTEKTTSEALLNHIITSVYQLNGDNASELTAALGTDIYTFPFSYRGGAEASTAFLLVGGTTPYILVGQEAQFDFIGLEEQGVLDEPEDEIAIEDDELDFSMM